MRRSLLFLFMFFNYILISGQSRIMISKPELSYMNNILAVKYNITGCGKGQYVDISMIVVNSKGDTLKPSVITGDIGNMIKCGPGKTIAWEVVRDNIMIDDDIEVMLVGKDHPPAVPIIKAPANPRTTRGKAIASSFFIPGLGQTMASGKGGYLLFSGLVYGAAGASAYFFTKEKKYYTDYLNSSGTEADNYFNKSEKSNDMGRYLIYGAAGAWVTNFIWSAVIPIKDKPVKKPALGLSTSGRDGLLISAKWTF
jgi:hypothetical protein